MFHFLFAKYAAVFSSRKQRGPPRCPWTPFCTSPGPAGLQMRNINQHSVCLQSLPVTLSFKIFREHARSSWFPAKHLKWPHSGDGWAKLSTHPSSTWKTCFGEVSFPWYFSPEGSDLCLFSVAFPVPDSVMFPSEPVKFPFLELFQVEEGFYNHDTPDDKWIRFSASAFDLASNGRRAREHLRAKGPILKNWAHILSLPGIISLLLKYLFHASLGCFVPCFQLLYSQPELKKWSRGNPKDLWESGSAEEARIFCRLWVWSLPSTRSLPASGHHKPLPVVWGERSWVVKWPMKISERLGRRRNRVHGQRYSQVLGPKAAAPLKAPHLRCRGQGLGWGLTWVVH